MKKKKKRSIWPLAILGALAMVLAGFGSGGDDTASARGGRGGGGRGGGRGGSRGARGGSRGPSGSSGAQRNNQRKEEQERIRREERIARVAIARIEYAKRERQQAWDSEVAGRIEKTINRLLGGSTE